MASNRHLGRIIALQSLYEYEFRSKAGDASADIDSIVAKNIEPYAKALGDVDFVHDLTHGVFDEMGRMVFLMKWSSSIKSCSRWRQNGQFLAFPQSTAMY